MSLRTSLNASDFEAPALEAQEGSQPPTQDTQVQPKHEEAIPYPRFQEVTHENQSLREQVRQYQNRLQQVQNQQQAPQQSLSGMQQFPQQRTPQQSLSAAQQQVVNDFKTELQDPTKSKEWQNRIAKEGPKALQEFVERSIQETGQGLLMEALQPIVQKLQILEGDYVSNTINRYTSDVKDPEFQAYRHLFENAVRHVAPTQNINNPQVLDTIRYWAQAQYRAQYGHNFQPPPQQQQPHATERPGSSYGFAQQPATPGRYAKVDADLAARFNLDPAKIQEARNRTVRNY